MKKKKNETTNVDICDSPVLEAAPFPLTVKLASGSLVRMGLRHGAPCGKYYSLRSNRFQSSYSLRSKRFLARFV